MRTIRDLEAMLDAAKELAATEEGEELAFLPEDRYGAPGQHPDMATGYCDLPRDLVVVSISKEEWPNQSDAHSRLLELVARRRLKLIESDSHELYWTATRWFVRCIER